MNTEECFECSLAFFGAGSSSLDKETELVFGLLVTLLLLVALSADEIALA